MRRDTEQTLVQLAETFKVRDIMVAQADLKRANDLDEAARLLDQYPDYDHIPLPATGPIGAYVARDDREFHRIQSSDLISDGASLLDLPELLCDRAFFFVLASNQIQGFVHFSDLNNSLVKLPLFALFEAIERHLSPRLVEAAPSDETLLDIIKDKRMSEIEQKRARASARRANRTSLDYLYFDEMLRLSQRLTLIELKSEDRQLLSEFRNYVAHGNPLIEEHRDVRRLVKVHNVALQLLASFQAPRSDTDI
jgi:hypothetical protein